MPSLLLISELCILGFSWAIFLLCPLDQTMNAFIGLFILSVFSFRFEVDEGWEATDGIREEEGWWWGIVWITEFSVVRAGEYPWWPPLEFRLCIIVRESQADVLIVRKQYLTKLNKTITGELFKDSNNSKQAKYRMGGLYSLLTRNALVSHTNHVTHTWPEHVWHVTWPVR